MKTLLLFTAILLTGCGGGPSFEQADAELKGTARHTLISSEELLNITGHDYWKNRNEWYVGYIPTGKAGFPVLMHEIGHHLGLTPIN